MAAIKDGFLPESAQMSYSRALEKVFQRENPVILMKIQMERSE